ncbi:MAG: hypothetical protein EOR22_25050 [Mesorhizobium sp.]|nr:MAG: hypothetical protein EOR22_25050 [Mesorhizobium sp.]
MSIDLRNEDVDVGCLPRFRRAGVQSRFMRLASFLFFAMSIVLLIATWFVGVFEPKSIWVPTLCCDA